MADGSKSANWSDATPAFQHNAHINDDTHSTSVTDRQKVARTINLACEGLWRRQPLDSAKTGLTVAQKSGLKAAVSAILFFLLVMPQATLLALYMIAMVLFSTMVILRLDAARLRLRFPEQTDQYPLLSPQEDWPTFTILVPLYREASVVRQSIEALSALRYPREKLQILYLLEADDLETLEAFEHCQLPLHFKVIIVPPSPPRTKPRALNYGLTLTPKATSSRFTMQKTSPTLINFTRWHQHFAAMTNIAVWCRLPCSFTTQGKAGWQVSSRLNTHCTFVCGFPI